jgi:hypothetical protein
MRWPRSRKKRVALFVLLALLLMGLFRISPSYTYIRITGDGTEVEVERMGFGPQRTVIKKGDMRAESVNW